MRKFGTRRAAAAVGVAAAAALLTGVTPAEAAVGTYIIYGQGIDACPSDSVCLYENNDFNMGSDARILVTDQDVPNLGRFDFNDTTSSFVNNSGSYVIFYQDYWFQGPSTLVNPGDAFPFVPPPIGQDALSSVRFIG